MCACTVVCLNVCVCRCLCGVRVWVVEYIMNTDQLFIANTTTVINTQYTLPSILFPLLVVMYNSTLWCPHRKPASLYYKSPRSAGTSCGAAITEWIYRWEVTGATTAAMMTDTFNDVSNNIWSSDHEKEVMSPTATHGWSHITISFPCLQYYSLPKPPPESGIQPRVLTIPFNIEGMNCTDYRESGMSHAGYVTKWCIFLSHATDQGSRNFFYPLRTILFDTNTSRHISYVVRGNDTERCTIDVEVTFRVTISNVSVLFLSQISVNMTNVTGLHQIVLRVCLFGWVVSEVMMFTVQWEIWQQ